MKKKQAIPAGRQAFTIIELLMYLSVFVILITVITVFAITSIKTVHKNQTKKEVSSAAYSIMRLMLLEIKTATSVYNPTSLFNTNLGQLSLETTTGLPVGERLSYVDFYFDDNNDFYLKRDGQEPQLLISDKLKVTSLEFLYIASISESIKINLTVEYNTTNPEYQFSYNLSSMAVTR
ncbi:MAG: hypothetical protein V1686_01480 [Patescibacteria group bacterium]